MANRPPKYPIEEWRGKRYGHLTIIDYKDAHFVCKCDCGNIKITKPSFLFNRKVTNCGLNCPHRQEQYDGRSHERLYRIWQGMKQRCYKPGSPAARYYYNRGIRICDEWRNDYNAFKKWALENGYEDGLTIDRIDSDGNYEPENCRWATYQEQRDNTRSPYTLTEAPQYRTAKLYEVDGEWKSLPEWADISGIGKSTLAYRIKVNGMTMKEALTIPKDNRGRKSNGYIQNNQKVVNGK